ncbi:hypothetical protein [Mucilaginibacter dorajii]|nr:hypothetical protein [Mucilaginibacter dorajii]MCS3732971.1 hypothetical protein [Mucilaginibacter dorajii]
MRKMLPVFIVLLLFACKHRDNHVPGKAHVDTIKIIKEAMADTSKHVDFLATGIFHEQIDSAQFKHKWKGIFYNKKGYYLADTKVSVAAVRDTMAGEDSTQATASFIKTDIHDQNVLLISGNLGLVNGAVKYLDLKKDQLLPGEQLKLNYNGKQFILYATGKVIPTDSTKGIDLQNIYDIKNYNLFIKGNAKEHYFDQLLVHINSFESGFCTRIEFAGDIDGDQIPDFIINTSSYGIGGVPTLYLSKMAGPKRLLVEVGGYSTAD